MSGITVGSLSPKKIECPRFKAGRSSARRPLLPVEEAGWVGGGEYITGKWSCVSWMTGWKDRPAEPAVGCLPRPGLLAVTTPSTYHTG